MTREEIYLALVLLAALVCFWRGKPRTDVTALLVLLSLLVPWRPGPEGRLLPVLSPSQAFSGMGSPAVVMVAAMFVLSAAMKGTGAAALLFGRVLSWGARSELRLQLTVLVAVTLFSAFVNDTTTVLVWMAPILAVCRERGIAPSRILLLLAYAALLGGQWTLIGTRSNIIVSDYLRTRTGAGLGFFQFTPAAAAVLAAAVAWFLAVGRRLLPAGSEEPSLAERYEVNEYLTEVMAAPGSGHAGKRIGDLDFIRRGEVTLLGIVRAGEHLRPSPELRIEPDDVFVIQGRIGRIAEILGRSDFTARQEMRVGDRTLRSVDLRMVEAIVGPGSGLAGRTLVEIDLQGRYSLSVLALGHRGRPVAGRPMERELAFGDSLLLVGHESDVARLRRDPDLLLLESRPLPAAGRGRAWLAAGWILFAVLASATKLLDPAFAIPLAAAMTVLTGCIGVRDAYAAIDLPSIFVVAGMIPFGLALESTGAAHRLAAGVAGVFSQLGPHALLFALLFLATLLTQLIENAAVAIILSPVAYELGIASGSNPAAFLLGLAICVSSAFSTPIAHEATILVMQPGRYRFADYLRVGGPMALLTWLVTAAVVPLLLPI